MRDRSSELPSSPAQAGFTLAEVLVSMVIAAAAMLAVSTLFIMSAKNTSKSRQMTSAPSLAQGLADGIRAIRPQDKDTTQWNLQAAYGTWTTDPTNPNPSYLRQYLVTCPATGGTTQGPSIQVTVRVSPLTAGTESGKAVLGKVYGQSRRYSDMVFYMQDPYINQLTGDCGIVGGGVCGTACP